MTQLASTTLSYDQIYFKIRDFYVNKRNQVFKTLEDESEAYGKLLRDIFSSLGSPIAKYDPYIKGEPPRSEKINHFSRTYGDDLNIVGRQLDYIAAKTINTFNMFSLEVENEKKYLERIGSKILLLQMYSNSPSNNLYYFGDSFDNMDKIDINRIKENFLPLVLNGQCTLPITKNKLIRSRKTIVNKTEGFLGNSHKVIRSLNSESTSPYKYIFEDNPTVGSISALLDSNPLSFVEFEVLNVDKNLPEIENYAPWEFSYLYTSPTTNGTSSSQMIDWSNFDMTKPLEMSYVIESNTAKANSIEIVPYFGSNNLIKINKVIIYKRDGQLENIINDPIYIGGSIIPPDISVAKNYFVNKATLRFSETEINKIEVFFEQNDFEQIEIGHVYWKPNYPAGSSIESPFYGLSRFNPESLSKDIYDQVEYDVAELIPSSNTPTELKRLGNIAKTIPVNVRTKSQNYEFWVLIFDRDLQFDGRTNPIESYFYGWVSDADNAGDGFRFRSSITYLNGTIDVKYYSSEEEGQTDFVALQELINSAEGGIVSLDGADYLISNIRLEKKVYTDAGRTIKYNVPIISQKQILPARRKSVGIRDISIVYESYGNKAEIVSKPFQYDKPVEAVMLSVNSNIDNTFLDKINVNYYISVSEGKWIPISPVQLDSRGIAEVIVFNKNISDGSRLPGVAYLNYPDVPKNINQISVKLELIKNREINATPIIYSYELITKVGN